MPEKTPKNRRGERVRYKQVEDGEVTVVTLILTETEVGQLNMEREISEAPLPAWIRTRLFEEPGNG